MNTPFNPFTLPGGEAPTCREMLQLILDGESTREPLEYFVLHMEQCPPCFQSYEVEMQIRQLLKSKCCREAPSGLKEAIQIKLNGQINF